MTSFDNDDPLGDLLSDGSNDSFFEEPKTLAKRASLTKPPDKKAISDLFGLNDEKPKDKVPSKESDWLGLGGAGGDKTSIVEPPKSAISNPDRTSLQSAKLSKKISFEDDDDILSSLVLERKSETATDVSRETDTLQRKIEPVKKSALIESIFGPPKQQSTETISSFEDILKDNKISKQKTTKPALSETLNYAPPEGRRSRHHSSGSGVLDPLGLFSNEPTTDKEHEETSKKPVVKPVRGEGDAGATDLEILHPTKPRDLKTKSASNIKDLPEWLGGGSPIKTHKSDTVIHKTEKTDEQRTRRGSVQYVELKEMEIENDKVESNAVNAPEVPMLESLLTQQKLATSHIEYQNTSIALQQQESQLLMALQLKKYEENLAEMQRKQQEILLKQEHQFNSLLERQFAKQQIMENNMRMQQERINNHIQLLISQPPVGSSKVINEEQEEMVRLKKNNADENSKLYEEMIITLKQRQHEEIFLLNESYKKQISLLESSMDAVENRLKTELTNLSGQFHDTVENIKKDHETEIDKYKHKLQEMSTLHVNEIKLIRENHNRIIEEIKYEYSSMVENMKQVKQTESSVLDNANTYTQKLDSNLEILDTNSKILIDIQQKVQHDYGVLSLAREESLKAKEEEIRLMRTTLEKSREAAETERAQLMTLVRTLEMKLVEQTQNAKEERWALQQAAAVLAARSAAFDREIEFTRASLEREKEQLKTLKESMLTEQEKVMLHLTEEKLSVSAEKARLETAAKLNQNYDTQKARAEIDAAIQVTKEAAELTDREREALHRRQSEVEILKRNLLDKERKLALRENELQEMLKNAERKAQDGEKAITEAKTLEAKYNARLKDIQGQLMSLMNREKKLAEEKISLSKERLSLHNSLRQVKKCSLCAADNLKPEESTFADDVVEQDFSPRIYPVADPDILRLRFEISEERSLNSKDGDENELKK